MRRSVLNTILFFILLFTIAGCRESTQQTETSADLQMSLDVESTSVGETLLVITLQNPAGEPINNAQIDVKGDMNHAGMIPVLAVAENPPESGVYRVPFTWTMGGDWIVTVTATLPDETTVSQDFDLSISAEGSSESALGNIAALGVIADCEAEPTEEVQEDDVTGDCSLPEDDDGNSFFQLPGG